MPRNTRGRGGLPRARTVLLKDVCESSDGASYVAVTISRSYAKQTITNTEATLILISSIQSLFL